VRRHPFRPLDAVLGLGLVILAVLVAVFGLENLDDDNVVVWCAIGAGVIGVALLPWPRRRESTSPTPLPDESSPDG
jgi:hypothetical protein